MSRAITDTCSSCGTYDVHPDDWTVFAAPGPGGGGVLYWVLSRCPHCLIWQSRFISARLAGVLKGDGMAVMVLHPRWHRPTEAPRIGADDVLDLHLALESL